MLSEILISTPPLIIEAQYERKLHVLLPDWIAAGTSSLGVQSRDRYSSFTVVYKHLYLGVRVII